jgi:hypothetical protein
MPGEHSSLRHKGNFHDGYASGHASGHGHEHESHLRNKDNPHSDAHQPHGKHTGEPRLVEHHIGVGGSHPHRMASTHVSGAHGFSCHTEAHRCGPLRLSGSKDAHRIGAKRK